MMLQFTLRNAQSITSQASQYNSKRPLIEKRSTALTCRGEPPDFLHLTRLTNSTETMNSGLQVGEVHGYQKIMMRDATPWGSGRYQLESITVGRNRSGRPYRPNTLGKMKKYDRNCAPKVP
jgi:hypothetical protein